MDTAQFVSRLDQDQKLQLAALGAKAGAGAAPETLTVAQLLKAALRNEIEAAMLAAEWMADTPELDAQLALARQCGDEAKHYRWIEERLRALGVDLANFDPRAPGPSPLLRHLRSLKTTVERAAGGQFAREAIAVVRNEVFARFCDEKGDPVTAALYRERIQPDEQHHHELGRSLLLKYATTETDQEKAHAAARRTIELAEEIQELMRMQTGASRLPGC